MERGVQLGRGALLALSATGISMAAGFAALSGLDDFLQMPTDEPARYPGYALENPYFLGPWLSIVALGAGFGFATMGLILWPTRLAASLPVVGLVTVAAAWASSQVFLPLSPIVSAIAGVTTMLWFRRHERHPSAAGAASSRSQPVA